MSEYAWSVASAEALRADWLKAMSAPILARGLALQRAGKVSALTFEGRLAKAWVASSSGGAPYGAEIELGDGPDDESVYCPCAYDAEFGCKHLVALAHAIVEHFRAGVTTGIAAIEVPTLATDASGCVPAVELEAWAREHGVEIWLSDDVNDVSRYSGRGGYGFSSYVLAGVSVGQLLTGERPSALASARARVDLGPIRRLALEHLSERARINVAARAGAAARRASMVPPTPPPVRAAWDRLAALRERLSPPKRWRARSEIPAPSVRFDAVASCVRYESHGAWGCERAQGAVRVEVHAGSADEPAFVRCRCETSAGCLCALAAVDSAMELLADGRSDEKAVAWRRAVAQAPWERVVERLDRLLSAPPTDEVFDGRELGWRVQLEPVLLVEPVLVRPHKNKKGFSCQAIRAYDVGRYTGGAEARADKAAASLLRIATHLFDHDARWAIPLRALRELVGHPRIFVREDSRGTPHPVRLERDEAALSVEVGEGGRIDLALQLTGRRLPMAEAAGLFAQRASDGLFLDVDMEAGRLAVCECAPGLESLVQGLGREAAGMSAEAMPALLARLPRLAEVTPLRLGRALRGERVEGWPGLVLRLELKPSRTLLVSLAVQPLGECPALPPGSGPDELLAFRDERAVHCPRELAAEVRAAEVLARTLGLDGDGTTAELTAFSWQIADLDAALELVSRTATLDAEAVRIEWADGRRVNVASATGLDSLSVEARRKRDWFDLAGGLEVEQAAIPLGKLLRAIREGQRFVAVGEDRWVRLGDALREALAPLAHVVGTGETISRYALAAVDQLEEVGAALDLPPEWLAVRRRVDEAATLDPPLPEGFAGELRTYQQDGYRWLSRLAHWGAGACLADDMGLGKTIQALALLAARAEGGPALVVAPTSVGFNWQRECARFAPRLVPLAFRGKADLDVFERVGPATVLITSYDLCVRYAEHITPIAWGTLVLDEAQAVKNPETRRARAIHAIDAGFRLALTGTPVENRTSELWSLFQAVTPGLLGTLGAFRERFIVPIERDEDVERRALLASLVRPFILRRLKTQVATELPARTEVDLRVRLSTAERAHYDEVREATLADLADLTDEPPQQRGFRVLTALTRLRQLACHPRLVHPGSTVRSSKVKALTELLLELRDEGHRALVFSQFTSLLALVREELNAAGLSSLRLDGSIEGAKRRALVDAFQAGEGDVFLLSLKAGGTGLNLTAADYVVHLDPWWNPAVEDQATDRAHRIGQTRPVTVYRLIAEDTVEDEMLRLHADKRELAEALLSGTGGGRALNAEDLARLLQATREPDGFAAEDFADADADADGEIDATPPAPAPRSKAATRRVPEAPSGAEAALAALDATLQGAVEAGRLASTTAATYRAGARHVLRFMAAEGSAWTAEAAADAAARYVATLSERPNSPTSHHQLIPTVARWLVEALAGPDGATG
ncbi:MAG: DEAD/DEAH box helicase [Myxococcota bacterium]